MIIIINKNKETNKFMPLLSIVENKEIVKKSVKKQIMNQIIEDPASIRAYKNLEIWKFGEIDEEFNLTETKKEKIVTYEELLNEIIENILQSEKKEESNK